MKNSIFIITLSVLVLFACGSNPKESDTEPSNSEGQHTDGTNALDGNNTETLPNKTSPTSTDLVEQKDYTELHPNGALKIEGNYDENEARHGLWISYYENGIKWSESNYSHGKKSGHSITFYPNGKVRYVGEYANDKQTGEWTFYDEAGKVTNTIKY